MPFCGWIGDLFSQATEVMVQDKQLHRWIVLAKMKAERRLKDLPCKDYFPKLQKALLEAIPNQ